VNECAFRQTLADLITVTLHTLQKYTSPSHLLWCL